MIRLIIILIYAVIVLVVTMPFQFVLFILDRFSPGIREKVSINSVHIIFKNLIFLAGTRVNYIGEENIPKDTAALYVGNHRSYFDVIIPGSRLPYPSTFIAKKEFNKIPMLNVWMHAIKCLMLDRSNIKEGLKTVLSAIDYIKEGRSIFVFPEGTRNKTQDLLLPFKDGALKISTKSHCPIIPVAITNSAEVFEAHFPKIKKADVIVHYGSPIYPDDLNKEELKHIGKAVTDSIEDMLKKDSCLIQ
ncbi:MAG: 1-acyl-sn-glycerol-3-phosphate acyltransferase [Lachnospiraceae bacterium]|nr:1-acyl-sn-glycerol-3-phosphate acyltransferase [Lachnospiraceae bacterium]